MDGDVGGSFRVHLQSLEDFASRLQEQLEVVQRSARGAGVFTRAPDLPLGAFAEAYSLSDDHSDAVRQAATLLEKVTRGIDFARSVTTLVASRYAALNTAGAQNIGAAGDAMPAAPAGRSAVATPTYPVTPTYPAAPPVAAPAVAAAAGTAAAPGSLAAPEAEARSVDPLPPDGGTVYYYNGSAAVPVSVTVQVREA